MSAKYINIDRETPMLFSPDLRDWIPKNSIVHFIIETVNMLDTERFSINHRGSGSPQYPPNMMLSLLIYSYLTGRFSSREIELASHFDVGVRYICGGDKHPDHDTICSFRKKNGVAFKEAFLKVLMVAQEMGHLKKVGSVSIDGTKIKANASKHSAVSYKRAGEMIEQLESEISELMRKAEEADNTPLEDGLTIPDEIARREDRKEKLKEAREIIEERYEIIKKQKQSEYEEKLEEREEKRRSGKNLRGRKPDPPSEEPPDKMQYNFTDKESGIMKAGNGKHFEQCYNAQATVDTEGSMMILGSYVTNHANDKLELAPALKSVKNAIRQISNASADTGYFSKTAILDIEEEKGGPMIYCAVEKQNHRRTVSDLLKKDDPPEPEEDATVKEMMLYRLKTKNGKEIYKKRKETVEPVFGIVKSVLGFRHFMLRGLEKVNLEWDLVTLAYNVKRLHKLSEEKKKTVVH
jgi:transposase